jgi:hypothetical protein
MKKLFILLSTLALIVVFNINIIGQQIFLDDFESGFESPEWDVYFANEDTLVAADMIYVPDPLLTGGNYVGYLQDTDGSNDGAALAIAGTTNMHDYSMEADVYCYVNYPGPFSAYTGIAVYADSTIGTYIKMVADFDADQRIRLYNNHLNTITLEYTFSHNFTASDIPGGIPIEDGWHKMKVEVRTINSDTTAFWCYFDDQQLLGCPVYDTGEDRIASGQFGLFSFQQDGDGLDGWFDNVLVNSLLTSVEENSSGLIPASFSLAQNYPNPFNPSTTIEFGIPESEFVNLTVHNLLGEQVDLLVDEYLPAGSYKAKWNTENLPSGAYIYTLSAGGFNQSKKMILMK